MTSDDLRVLIVDDKQEHAEKLQSDMEQLCGEQEVAVETHIACTADKSVTQIEQLDGVPHLFAFCDLSLGPDWVIDGRQYDGWRMLKYLREKLPLAKTVMYSSLDRGEDLQRALAEGAFDLVDTSNLEDTAKGLLRVFAQFAAIDKRLREARRAEEVDAGDPEKIDPLAHLLLKVRTGLLIVGRHGGLWFQNEHNKAITRCPVDRADLCYRLFRNWKCQQRECPWCPTLEAVRKKEAKERTLLLPVRTDPDADTMTLACVEMASEPLWPLGGDAGDDCAGAIECAIERTAEWKAKRPVEQVLDLLVSIAGMFVSAKSESLALKLCEVSRSGLLCHTVAACVVEVDGDQYPTIEENVQLLVQSGTPGWQGAPVGPGPAAACREGYVQDAARCESSEFALEDHPAGRPGAPASAVFNPNQMPEAVHQRYSLPVGNAAWHWRYLLLQDHLPNGAARPVGLLEVATASDSECLGDCLAERQSDKACDLDICLSELGRALSELREERMEERGRNVPTPPTFDGCDSREALWQSVHEGLEDLGQELNISEEGLWWHYREYEERTTPGGGGDCYLCLPEEILEHCGSPYAKLAYEVEVCREVAIPPPHQWGKKGAKGKLLEEDPEAISGMRYPRHQEHSGSWLCRASGEPILKHTPPAKHPTQNLTRILDHARITGQEAAAKRLESIRSFADFPVGSAEDPVGTFHVQSVEYDLFIPKVTDYLWRMAKGIERALLRIRSRTHERKLAQVLERRFQECIIRSAVSGRLAEVAQLMTYELSTSLPNASAALVRSIRGKADGLVVLGQLLGDVRPNRRKPKPQVHDLGALVRESVAQMRNDMSIDPAFANGLHESVLPDPELSSARLPVDGLLLTEAIDAVLRWALTLWEHGRAGQYARITIELSRDESSSTKTLRVRVGPCKGVDILKSLQQICDEQCDASDLYARVVENDLDPNLKVMALELACARLLGKHALDGAPSKWSLTDSDGSVCLKWILGQEED